MFFDSNMRHWHIQTYVSMYCLISKGEPYLYLFGKPYLYLFLVGNPLWFSPILSSPTAKARNKTNRTYRRSITRKNLRVGDQKISSFYRTSCLSAKVMSLRVNVPSKVWNFNHNLTNRNLTAFTNNKKKKQKNYIINRLFNLRSKNHEYIHHKPAII